jgi:hypothetical protein
VFEINERGPNLMAEENQNLQEKQNSDVPTTREQDKPSFSFESNKTKWCVAMQCVSW